MQLLDLLCWPPLAVEFAKNLKSQVMTLAHLELMNLKKVMTVRWNYQMKIFYLLKTI